MRSSRVILFAAILTLSAGALASPVGAALIRGTDGADTLGGTRQSDKMYGLEGGDVMRGGNRGDLIQGNRGADTLRGNRGSDDIAGGSGADRLYGGDGRDRLDARDGGSADTVDCGLGDDSVLADPGDVLIDCEAEHVGCSVADALGCVPGSTLTLTDDQFFCNRPLSQYGSLPLKVVVNFTPGRLFGGNGAVDLTTGCAGDDDPATIDLIVDVRGNGTTYGPGIDALKVRQEAGYNGGIQLTGHVDCGPKYRPEEHQDGVQLQGGRDITFVDFSVGDYAAGRSTCQGAGGAMFYSGASGWSPINVDVVRGEYIACNHSLYAGDGGTGDVRSAKFRSGRTDGTDPLCDPYNASPACDGDGGTVGPGVTVGDVVCQRWNSTHDRWDG